MTGALPPLLVALSLALVGASAASAAPTAPAGAPAQAPAKPAAGPATLLPGANSKQPISIDANRLDYFDKEQKLVYTGDVVAVQGETTLKGSVLTIFLQKDPKAGSPGGPAPAGAAAPPSGQPASAGPAGAAAAGPGAGSSVKHMDVDGPVTLISKDQVATGNRATYDKAQNKVSLIGNVTMSQGPNVIQGDTLVYDLDSGKAQIFSGATTGRVKSVFTPGSSSPMGPAKPGPAKAPRAAGKVAPPSTAAAQ